MSADRIQAPPEATGLAFSNNSWDVAAQIALRARGDLSWKHLRAALLQNGVSPLRANDLIILTTMVKDDKGNETVTSKTITLVDAPATALMLPNVSEEPKLPEPPKLAEVLLVFCAKSKHGKALVGCLNEQFAQECGTMGLARARRRYWAEAARSVLPMTFRELCRALKWLAVLEVLYRRL